MESVEKYYLRMTEVDRKNRRYWKMAREFREGDEETLVSEGYILPFHSEGTVEAKALNLYQDRIKRSYPLTLTNSILHAHKAHLAQNISFSGVDVQSEQLQTILDDVTGYDKSHKKAYTDLVCDFLSMGMVGVLVEGTANTSQSEVVAREQGERSYQTIIRPEHIYDLQKFHEGKRKGQVRCVTLFKGAYPVKQPEAEIQQGKEPEYKLHFRRYYYEEVKAEDGSKVISESYKVVELKTKSHSSLLTIHSLLSQPFTELEKQGEIMEGALEEIPFYTIGNGPESASIMRAVIYLDQALLNKTSVIGNTNYYQAFRKILIAGELSKEDRIAFAANLVAFFDNPDIKPHVIEPGNAEAVEKERDFIISWAVKIGMLRFSQFHDEGTKQVQSAESKAKDLDLIKEFYNDILDEFEPFLRKIYNAHAEFEGLQATDDKGLQVNLARDFNGLVDPEQEQLDDALILANHQKLGEVGDKLFKQVMAKVVSRMRINPEEEESQAMTRNQLIEEVMNATIQKDDLGLIPPGRNPRIAEERNRLNAQDTDSGRASAADSA